MHPGAFGAAEFAQARERVLGNSQVRIALVVAEHYVVLGFLAVDQVLFQDQGLVLGPGFDNLHAAGFGDHLGDTLGKAGHIGVILDTLGQILGLAHIKQAAGGVEHAVHPGQMRCPGLEFAYDVEPRGHRCVHAQIIVRPTGGNQTENSDSYSYCAAEFSMR